MCFHLIPFAQHPPINHVSMHMWPLFGHVVESIPFQPKAEQTCFRLHTSFAFISPFKSPHYVGSLQISAAVQETLDVDEYSPSLSDTDASEELQFDSYSTFTEMLNVSRKESDRRRKIGLANKGNVPWNKGIKHDAETRARIKQRTIEALKDPKVRQKMSENPRAQSDESKLKIGSSLKRVWRKRLNLAQLREKFYLSWATTIANAAKKGGIDQAELDWNAYDTLKEEVASQKLLRLADKAQVKERTKLRKERAAAAKAARLIKLVQRKNAREEKEKTRKALRKSREEKEELENAQEMKLKERLTKIHKKKSINIKTQEEKINSKVPELEKFDLEFIKREKMRNQVSLEEQILAAKSKKEAAAAASPYSFLVSELHKT